MIDAAPTPTQRPFKVVGVDPGLHGGWVMLDHQGYLIAARNFPVRHNLKSKDVTLEIDTHTLAAQLDIFRPTHAFIENVSSRPRQAGAFKFGFNTGLVHGVLATLDAEIQTVPPQTWKAIYGIKRHFDENKRATKNEARAIATNLFPQSAKLFSRVKDDGVAEAALIALYGYGQLSKGAK